MSVNLQQTDAETSAANGSSDVKEKAAEVPGAKEVARSSKESVASQLEMKIIRQVEYYFGDRNLPRDKFLQCAAAENEGGWVPVATLLTFNRLNYLSSDPEEIIRALRKSSSGILEVNSDGSSVRRSPDNPPPDIFSAEQRQKMKEKTVYVKGFDEAAPLDDIQGFFEQYGQLEHVHMRRLPADRKFKGSVFAEFKDKKVAEDFLKLPKIELKGRELFKESKEAYHARKNAESKKGKQEKKQQQQGGAKEESKQEPEVVLTKGAVLFFKGDELSTSREEIKEEMRAHATVAFIDFARGDKQGYIRFEDEGSASKVLDALKEAAGESGAIKLCGVEVEVRVLEGDEEKKYWLKAQEQRMGRSKRGGRGKRGRGRGGGRGGDRKRKHDDDGEGSPVKQQKKAEDDGDED